MDDFFGTIMMILVVGSILGGLGLINVKVSVTEPNEVTAVVAPVVVETAPAVAPVKKKFAPIVKVAKPIVEQKKPTVDVIIELDELDSDVKTDAPLFIDLE